MRKLANHWGQNEEEQQIRLALGRRIIPDRRQREQGISAADALHQGRLCGHFVKTASRVSRIDLG